MPSGGQSLNQDIGTHIADIFGTVFSRLVSQYADDKVIPEVGSRQPAEGYAEIVGRPPQVTKAELEDMKPAEMAAVLRRKPSRLTPCGSGIRL